MDHPFLQLSIFLTLASFDTGNAIYNRYIAQVAAENKVRITRATIIEMVHECTIVILHNFVLVQVAYAAHIAGAGAGFLVGIYVLRNLIVHRWERLLWWISFVVFNGLIVAAIFWNIFCPSYFSLSTPC